MSKYIYTWHPEIKKYSIRIATSEETLRSQKTGKEYKQYLTEVGKRINPTAYKEK